MAVCFLNWKIPQVLVIYPTYMAGVTPYHMIRSLHISTSDGSLKSIFGLQTSFYSLLLKTMQSQSWSWTVKVSMIFLVLNQGQRIFV